MAKEATRVQDGDIVSYTAGAAYSVGDVIPLVDRVGVALNDVASGDVVSLALEGAWEITAATAGAVTFGALLYWDDTNKVVTTDSDTGSNVFAGIAITTKAVSTAGNVTVRIGF